jgi:hypothetical protein
MAFGCNPIRRELIGVRASFQLSISALQSASNLSKRLENYIKLAKAYRHHSKAHDALPKFTNLFSG